jgi:uncharacterized protein (TIGR02246 family)
MEHHPLELLIEQADAAINREDFDTLIDIYSDDAVLVIKPGMHAIGKTRIRQAFEAIAAHFEHSLHVHQAAMKVLESGNTALVLARTVVSAANLLTTERNATYVFEKGADGRWRCTIDNSYGHALLSA